MITNLNKQVGNHVFSNWMWKLLILWSMFECPRTKRNSNQQFISGFAAVHLSGFYTYSLHLRGPVSTPLPLQLFHHTSARWCYASAPDPINAHPQNHFLKRNSTPRSGAASTFPFPHMEFTLSWILNLGISFTVSSISSFWLVSRTSSSAITARVLSRLEISSCKI